MHEFENLVVFGEADENTLKQMENCMVAGDAPRGALCADNHLGYSAPIGSAVAYRDMISPSGVGFDIACGNKAVQTLLRLEDIDLDIPRVMDEIQSRISFGVGRKNNEPVDHEVLDNIARYDWLKEVRDLEGLAGEQLGTVGAGNHYVNLFVDKPGYIWVGVHFGSRGFGHKVASGFLALAEGLSFSDKYKEGEMMSPPKMIPADTPTANAYLEAMYLAGEYAYAGRDTVVDKVLEILGAESTFEVHNHHNYMWREKHGGEVYWVVRKGSTPLFPGQYGFIGSTMGEESVIVRGKASEEAGRALFSAPHGAGRVMSRSKAAGKWKRRWVNNLRDDSEHYATEEEALKATGATKAKKVRVRLNPLIDYELVKQELAEKGIEIRGGAADEAPEAYKRLPKVLDAHKEALEVVDVLTPIGVCMADDRVHDPYKD